MKNNTKLVSELVKQQELNMALKNECTKLNPTFVDLLIIFLN
ncbi:MAG: hypothetical protein K0S11_1839 [Gammaproteobacteria bacterium]|jgi:hypothetical protein|nr:hypothetical protein [Gammaproteobacteria bacterium]